MKPITYYVDTPVIQSLCQHFGSRWERMDIEDKAAIMAILSLAMYQFSVSRSFDDFQNIADFHEIKIAKGIYRALRPLQKQLTPASIAQLLSAISTNLPVGR